MTATARIGERPTVREDLDRALALIAEQADVIAAHQVRIAALEARGDADDQIDGPAPAALPSPPWVPIKTAATLVGYSESALRKASKGGRAVWWQARGCRIWIDPARCPRRV
jgi:hypothetical protein